MKKELKNKELKLTTSGFTLIELIAVLIILAVIGLITMPIVNNSIENSRERALEEIIKNLEHATKLYITENVYGRDPNYKTISFAELKKKGYIENKDVINPTTNEELTGCIGYKWDTDNNQYKIEYNAECELKEDEVVLVGTPIIDKVKELVYDLNSSCKTDGTTYEYMGGCYIKSAPSTTLKNHIWYNGFLWRIMGINNDGSIRMITEENVTSIAFNNVDDVTFAGSDIDKWLNNYFYNKLSNKGGLRDIIVDGSFYQEPEKDYQFYPQPTSTEFMSSTLKRKVGLISADEYANASPEWESNNYYEDAQSYLSTHQSFWTLTIHENDNIISGNPTGPTKRGGVRPVINIKGDVLVTSGTGTLNSYYTLGEEKNIAETLNNVKVGEYVSLNNKTYRVVENGTITKLILEGYYQENGSIYEMQYGSDNVFTIENRNTSDATLSGIGYKLNTDVLNWLTAGSNQQKLKNMILPSTWYQNEFYIGDSYEVSLNESNPTRKIENVQVGLIRIGEMLSGQSYSILTKNGSEVSNYNNAASYWVMTPRYLDSRYAWYVDNYGYVEHSVSVNSGLRPVINISSTNTIASGNGTPNSPYVIQVN